MSLPLIMLVGKAGSGKDTVANYLAEKHGAVVIANADPMKRYINRVFGVKQEFLWGASELRGEKLVDLDWPTIEAKLRCGSETSHFLYEMIGDKIQEARGRLEQWFSVAHNEFVDKGYLTARFLLQTIGTEWGRFISRDMWIKKSTHTAIDILKGGFDYHQTLGLVADPDKVPKMVIITDGRFLNEVVEISKLGGQNWKLDTPEETAIIGGVSGHVSEKEQGSIPVSYFNVEIVNDKSLGLDRLHMKLDKAVRDWTRASWSRYEA